MIFRLSFILVSSYLIGCFSTAYYLVRWRLGQDIRDLGSGNAGAKNTARVLGRWGFLVVFLGDVGKGALAVWLTGKLSSATDNVAIGMSAAMLAVVIGHLYPVQLGFRGGKGASTAYGAVLVINPLLAIIVMGFAGVVYVVTRSLAGGGFTTSGLIAIAAAPFIAFALSEPIEIVTAIGILCMILFYSHRANLSTLIQRS